VLPLDLLNHRIDLVFEDRRVGLGAEHEDHANHVKRQKGVARQSRQTTAVHGAAQELLTAIDRAEVIVPMTAEKAGVTPSTIYRSWGDLADFLATSQSRACDLSRLCYLVVGQAWRLYIGARVTQTRGQPVRGPPAQLVPITYSPWRLWR